MRKVADVPQNTGQRSVPLVCPHCTADLCQGVPIEVITGVTQTRIYGYSRKDDVFFFLDTQDGDEEDDNHDEEANEEPGRRTKIEGGI